MLAATATSLNNDYRGASFHEPQFMSQEKVLIVEDEENERTGLAELVQAWGYRTDTAKDGLDALEKVLAWSPGIVVTDLKMPRMDGMEVLRRLRQTTELPVIMATARDQSEEIVHALRLGANDYVTKPLDFPVVLARVQTQLVMKRAVEERKRAG